MTLGGPAIFISYKRDHEASLAVVTALEAALAAEGVQVLRDVHIEPGERWPDELWRWLMECSGAVAVVSDEAAESDWCRREWSVLAARRVQAGLQVIPVHVGPLGPRANILADIQAVVAEPGEVSAVATAVVERLRGLPAAPLGADDHLAAHRAWLGWLYAEAPALGREPFSLADVYVETECGTLTWEQLKDDRSVDPFSEECGGRADLVETVLGCFGDPDLREPIVVQGPAGSGKSAFCLHLANRLADEGLVPVLVRFRDLRLSTYDGVDELLEDAVRVAPVGEHPPPPAEALFSPERLSDTVCFRDADICRTVVILDGWDEVTLTGSVQFRNQIEEWLPRLRQRFTDRPGPPVRLLLTGRPSTAVDRSGLLRRKTSVLTIRPLRPDRLRHYAARISRHLAQAGRDGRRVWTLDLARCERAFASYEAWFKGEHRRHPRHLRRLGPGSNDDHGTDVLGSPLLALLAFRTVAEWPADTGDLFAKPTALHHALIEITTRHAGKAEEGPEGTVHRGGRTLRRLLQRVASIITTQGGESVSFDELDRRLEDDAALRDWTEQAEGESTLHELVVNFYFKGHPELGCEFLHKSFREYLFSEAVVAALEAVSEGRSGPHAPPPREWGEDFASGSPHHDASRSLASLLAPQWLTPEVRTHLFWLVERAASADPDRWVWIRDLLNDVYAWWAEGVPLRMHQVRRRGRDAWESPTVVEMLADELPRDGRPWRFSPSTNALDAHLGDALIQLTAFVHWLLADRDMVGSRPCQTGEPDAVRFRPFRGDSANLIACIGSARGRPIGDGVIGACLRAVDVSDELLAGCDLSWADLEGATLSGAVLARASLVGARLVGADLAGANLFGADLTDADLTDAQLTGADLTGARLIDANLERAQLRDVRYDGSTTWPTGFTPPSPARADPVD
jgi:thymidylate kinase